VRSLGNDAIPVGLALRKSIDRNRSPLQWVSVRGQGSHGYFSQITFASEVFDNHGGYLASFNVNSL